MIDRLVQDAKVALLPVRGENCHAPLVTANACKAVELGRLDVNSGPSTSICSAHLLRGLIAEKDGVAARLLHLNHVDVDDVRSGIAEIESRMPELAKGEERHAIAASAVRFAARAGAPSVGTEHLLAALVKDSDLTAVHLLRDLSVDVGKLGQHLTAMEGTQACHAILSSLVPLTRQNGFERFSNSLLEAIKIAQGEALRIGRGELDSQLLFFGLIQARSGKAVEVLRKAGISTFEPQFTSEYPPVRGGKASSPIMYFSTDAVSNFQVAFKTARLLGHEMITPDVLILTLLRDDGQLAPLLKSLNVNVIKVRSSIFVSTGLASENFDAPPLDSTVRGHVSGTDGQKGPEFELSQTVIDGMLNDLNSKDFFATRFNSGAVWAIRAAMVMACCLGQTMVGSEHLLMGISAEGNSRAAKMLTEAQLPTKAIGEAIESSVENKAYQKPSIIPFSQSAKDLFGSAFVIVQKTMLPEITCDAIFIAILESGKHLRQSELAENAAIQVLESLGIDHHRRDKMLGEMLVSVGSI
jgi:ATP-dependent Clp protease ATP-binding subunit ClpA